MSEFVERATQNVSHGGQRANAGRRRACLACGVIIPKGKHSVKLNDSAGGYDAHGRVMGHLCPEHAKQVMVYVRQLRVVAARIRAAS